MHEPVDGIYRLIKGTSAKATLALLPGVGCGAFVFAEALPQLLRHFNIVLFNNPGIDGAPQDFGQSLDVLDVHHLTDQAELALQAADEAFGALPWLVWGHSMGGFTAQQLALRCPAKIRRLILMSTSYGGVQTDLDVHRVFSTLLMGNMRELKHHPDHLLELMMAEDIAPALKAKILHLFATHEVDLDVLLQHYLCGARFSSVGEVRDISCPTLVVHGAADRIILAAAGEALAQQLPAARLWAVPQAGHLPFLEKPDMVLRLADFLLGDETVGAAVEQAAAPAFFELQQDMLWRHTRQGLTSIRRLFQI